MSLNTVISKRGCSKKFSVDLFSILSKSHFTFHKKILEAIDILFR